RYLFGIVRDEGPMKPHLALDVNYRGLLVEVIDAPSEAAFSALETTLRDEILPEAIEGSPAAMVLGFTPKPFDQGLINDPSTPAVAPPDGVGKQICLLWFLEDDPAGIADARLHSHHA